MKKHITIAIDGPSGVGKSTISKLLADRLNISYIDTGSMYRALALKAKDNNINFSDSRELAELLNSTTIDFNGNSIILDGQVVDNLIRTDVISKLSSSISKNSYVREQLVELQRQLAENKSVVMEGRDITTVVLPEADFKFYLTATPQARAKRRYHQLLEKGEDVNLSTIERDIIKRDREDMTRENSPLKKAEDAIEIDSSGLSVEESLETILGYINEGYNV